jgi:hypothetical protein
VVEEEVAEVLWEEELGRLLRLRYRNKGSQWRLRKLKVRVKHQL